MQKLKQRSVEIIQKAAQNSKTIGNTNGDKEKQGT